MPLQPSAMSYEVHFVWHTVVPLESYIFSLNRTSAHCATPSEKNPWLLRSLPELADCNTVRMEPGDSPSADADSPLAAAAPMVLLDMRQKGRLGTALPQRSTARTEPGGSPSANAGSPFAAPMALLNTRQEKCLEPSQVPCSARRATRHPCTTPRRHNLPRFLP